MPFEAGPIFRLKETLRQNPVVVPLLGALALFVIWAGSEAGYPLTHWAPGGLILLALLVITLSVLPLRLREIPVAVRVALACLALYTALSFLSILWAQVPGMPGKAQTARCSTCSSSRCSRSGRCAGPAARCCCACGRSR